MSNDKTLVVSTLTEGDITAKLAALAMVQDDPNKWAEVQPDFGKTVEFKEVGDHFLGLLVSRKEVEQPDLNNPGQTRMATVYELMGTDGERYSVWGSYSIENKLDNVPDGTPVLIEYRGKDEFKDKTTGQPRTVGRYKVSMPVSGESR